jgi:hypothetical protein
MQVCGFQRSFDVNKFGAAFAAYSFAIWWNMLCRYRVRRGWWRLLKLQWKAIRRERAFKKAFVIGAKMRQLSKIL